MHFGAVWMGVCAYSKWDVLGTEWVLTGSFSLAVRSVDVGFHLRWCLVQWSDITDLG